MKSTVLDASMRYALEQIKGMETAGERRKWLDEYFGEDGARSGYRCLRCSDTGHCPIYHPKLFVQLSNQQPLEFWRRVIVVCDCSAADRVALSDRRGNQFPVFGDRDWHIATNLPDSRATLENFDLRRLCNEKRYAEFEEFA